MRLAVYLRVSTSDKQDTAMQLRDIETYSKLHNHEIIEIFKDHGFSGRNMNRPALKELLGRVRGEKKEFDGIIVWKFDRFARSLGELITMLKVLSQNRIEFVSVKDNIDFSTPHGKLMLHIVGAFSEFESDLIRMRVKAGIDHAKAHGTRSGKAIGRPRDRDDYLIRRTYMHCSSYRQTAKKLNLPVSTVFNSIKGSVMFACIDEALKDDKD